MSESPWIVETEGLTRRFGRFVAVDHVDLKKLGAQVGYTLNHIDIVNLSKEPWNDVEIWVNQNYVVHLPVMEPNKLKTIEFTMLYDDKGNYFPLDNSKVLVKKGKAFDVVFDENGAIRMVDEEYR